MKAVVIDVRTPKEFSEDSYPGAINLPSTEFNINDYLPYANHAIGLVCFSGNRAKKVHALLKENGFEEVYVMEHQMVHTAERTSSKAQGWSVDRQFRLALGLLIGCFLLGNYVFSVSFSLAILLLVFSGLIFSAVTDNCYLKMLIGILPWNRRRSESSEIAVQSV